MTLKSSRSSLLFLLVMLTNSFGSPSQIPPDDSYELVFEDNFDAPALNLDHWMHRTGSRQKFNSFNLPENVSLSGGRLIIVFDKKTVNGEEHYTAGGIISKSGFGYGYYETKSRLWGGGAGLHSSFWSMGMDQKNQNELPKYNRIIEIDGYEVDSEDPTGIHTNVHFYIGQHVSTGQIEGLKDYDSTDTSIEDFTFGYEWLPDRINWYLNGTLIRTLKNPSFYAQQNVWLTALATPNGFGGGAPVDDRTLPGESSWDYFRFYVRPLPGINLLGNGSFEYDSGSNNEPRFSHDPHHPIAWIQEGDVRASTLIDTREAFDGTALLRFDSPNPYRVTTRQHLNHIANGTYELSAMVRSSGGQEVAKIEITDYGQEPRHIDIPATSGSQWQKVKLDSIDVTKNQSSISIVTQSDAENWLEVDDIIFALKTKSPPIIAPQPILTQGSLGAILLDDSDATFQNPGNWKKSLIRGKIGTHRYSDDRANWARWTPDIPEEAEYRIEFYNIRYSNNAPEIIVQIESADGLTERVIRHQGSQSGWEDLGVFRLGQGKSNYVKLNFSDKTPGQGHIRADSVRFTPVSRSSLDNGLILKVGHNYVIQNKNVRKIDRSDPALVPIRSEDGEIFIPTEWASRELPKFTRNEETPEDSHKGNDLKDLNTLTQRINEIPYISASDLAAYFGLAIIFDPETGIILIQNESDLTIGSTNSNLFDKASQLFPEK